MPFALWLCHFSYVEEKESASLLSQPGLVCDLLWPMECSRTTPEPVPSLGTAYIFSWKSSSSVWPSTVNLVEDEKPCVEEIQCTLGGQASPDPKTESPAHPQLTADAYGSWTKTRKTASWAQPKLPTCRTKILMVALSHCSRTVLHDGIFSRYPDLWRDWYTMTV